MTTISRQKIDTSIEDKILIHMIMSDDFLRDVRAVYQPDYLQGAFGRTVASWCSNHYVTYGRAPGRHIQDIFDQHVRKGLGPDTADLIEQFLSRISKEFERTQLDVAFALDEAEEFFQKRAVQLLHEDIGSALSGGEDPKDISQLITEHANTPFDLKGSNFSSSLMTSTQLLEQRIRVPKAYVWPWLREGSLSMIYAARGVGKSWLGLILGVALTRENFRDIEIGPWDVKYPAGVLFIDGEMGSFDVQDRIRQIAEPLGKESKKFPLLLFSAPDYVDKHREAVNIIKPAWQDRFYNFLKSNRRIRVVILDNLSSLTTGRDENDNQAASILNAWLVKVRSIGVAVIIVHHAGKSGDQRGASSLEDALNNTILLKRPKDAKERGACFSIMFTKARNDPGGEGYRSFMLKLEEHDDNPRWRKWGIA